jgi:exodeoxyribonuclease VII small subunit
MSNEDGQELKFGEAVTELEEILHRIESEEIDIDELAAELKKAAELLELCRSKIRKAEVEVTQIVQSLDSESEADGRDDDTVSEPEEGS